MTVSHRAKRIAFTFLLCLSVTLISCETTGGGRMRTSPEVVTAKQALLASLGDYTVDCKWVTATKRSTAGGLISHDYVTGGTRSLPPNISSNVIGFTWHYSGWNITEDGLLQWLADGDAADGIPIQKVERVFIHDRQESLEAAENASAGFDKLTGFDDESMWGKRHEQTLSENLSGAATVEFVLNTRDWQKKYRQIYFPNRQRAEAFVAKWNQLVAALSKA